MQQYTRVVFIAKESPILSVLRDSLLADPAVCVRSTYVFFGQVPREKSTLDADVAVISMLEQSNEGEALIQSLLRRLW